MEILHPPRRAHPVGDIRPRWNTSGSADDGGNGLCASGPWGFVSACVQGPGWVDWNPGWGWNGGWDGGHHGEDGNSQGGD